MIKDYGIALAKLLIAGAWVDGELSGDEIRAVESFLDTVPGLNEEDLKRVHLYAEFPMNTEESRKVTEDFVRIIRTEEEKELALLHLDALVKADRIVTPEERFFYSEMLDYLRSAPTNTLARFSKLVKGPNKWKSAEVLSDQTREDIWLDHYMNNPVYFRLRVSYMGFDLPDDLPEKAFQQACLHASLMVCIEMGEGRYRPDIIADHLEAYFKSSPEVAAYLADLAASEYHNGRMNVRRQCLQLAKVVELSRIEDVFVGIMDVFAKSITLEAGKHSRIREVARVLKIDDKVTENAIGKLVKETP